MALDVSIAAGEKDTFLRQKVNLPSDPAQAGFVALAGRLGEASDPAGALFERIRTSTQGRLTVGQAVPLLNEVFNNTALNSAIYQAPTTTMTVTVGGGTLNLNASAINTINTVARVATYAFFPLYVDMAIYATFDMALSQAPQTNNVVEAGFFQASASTAPTDGCFFRWDAAGTLKAVMSTNGTEVTSAALTNPSVNVQHKFKIIIENDRVLFYIDGALQSVIAAPTTLGAPIYAASVPFAVRTYNGGVAPTLAQVVKLAYLIVGMQDGAGVNRPAETLAAMSQRMGSTGQTGQTMGSTALLTNSLAAGAGVAMTNTTAALGSGLGGQFSAQPTLAVGTDGIVCSYQNPAATSAISGKTLFIRGVRVQSAVTTALTGGPCVFGYSLAYGHTGVSLATSEGATSKAPRRVPIGFETLPATAAVGAVGSPAGVDMKFLAPIAINPGEFVAITAKNLGVVTSAGVVTFLVAFDAYWE